jgi:hypothetical protein
LTPELLRMRSRTLNGAVWTHELVAHEVGCHPKTVAKIESGEFKHQRSETWSRADMIAKVLGVPRDQYRMAVLNVRRKWLEGLRRIAAGG